MARPLHLYERRHRSCTKQAVCQIPRLTREPAFDSVLAMRIEIHTGNMRLTQVLYAFDPFGFSEYARGSFGIGREPMSTLTAKIELINARFGA